MTAQVKSLGGTVHMEPQDIPSVGRFSFVADQHGALIYLMRGDHEVNSTAFAQSKTGHACWNKIVARNTTAVLEFYGDLLGWTKIGAIPMDDRGDYLFLGHAGEAPLGAMMTAIASDGHLLWHVAFNVQNIDAAHTCLIAEYDGVTHGPKALPNDDHAWLIRGTDGQWARVMFSGARQRALA